MNAEEEWEMSRKSVANRDWGSNLFSCLGAEGNEERERVLRGLDGLCARRWICARKTECPTHRLRCCLVLGLDSDSST